MKTKRKLLFYNNGLGRGGAHHSQLAWIDLLRQEPDLELVLVCHSEGWFTEQLRQRGLPYRLLPMPAALAEIRHGQWKNRAKTALRVLSMAGGLLRAWWQCLFLQTDGLILTGGRDFIVLFPLALRKRKQTATVPQTTDWGEIPACRTMCKLASKTFAISREVASTITAMGVPPERVSVLPLIYTSDSEGLHPEKLALRRELGIPNRSLVMGMAGVVRPHKGQLEAVRVLHEMRNRAVDAHLVLVGAPPADAPDAVDYFARVKAEVARLNLEDRVTFAGWQSNVTRWMRAFDILLVPSHDFEGVPRVILEGLESSLPIVASNLPQFQETLANHGTGSLHSVGDAAAWADSITALWEAPERMRQAGRRAREVWTEHYSEQAARTHLVPAFKSLTAR